MTSSSGNIFRVTGPFCGVTCEFSSQIVDDLRRHRADYDVIVMKLNLPWQRNDPIESYWSPTQTISQFCSCIRSYHLVIYLFILFQLPQSMTTISPHACAPLSGYLYYCTKRKDTAGLGKCKLLKLITTFRSLIYARWGVIWIWLYIAL